MNCYASLWTWLNTTAADCPISYAGFTLYATIDAGVGYESNGAGFNGWWNNGVSNIITKQSTHGPQWLWTPNGLSQSVVGIKMSEPLWNSGWSLIGVGGNRLQSRTPMQLAYAQRAQVQNNGKSLFLQNANANSSRTGQPFNSQVFLGVSNKTYGTLTAGRVNTLSLDAINAYDPMGGSYAFSPLGYSGSYAGFGDTEAARVNTAVKYRVDIQNFRVGGLVQWGGYDQGNGTNGLYQAQIGGDFHIPNIGGAPLAGRGRQLRQGRGEHRHPRLAHPVRHPHKGPFEGETGCSYDSGAPGPSRSTTTTPTCRRRCRTTSASCWPPSTSGSSWTLYGGYTYLRQSNPSDNYPNGFETIGYYNVPGTIPQFNVPGTFANKNFPTQWAVNNAYNINRVAPYWWIGVKYAITPQLDLIGAYYILSQNDYNFTVNSKTGITTSAACSGAVTTGVQPNGTPFSIARSSSGKCAGSTDFISFLIDYRPVKRVDVYAGVMVVERLRRPGERLLRDPDDQPDRRHPHQVLRQDQAAGASPPPSAFSHARGHIPRVKSPSVRDVPGPAASAMRSALI